MMRRLGLLLVCLLSLPLGGCASSGAAELRVFCAASLASAVTRTARAEGIPIRLNSGGSNVLVRQASMGAPVDLLLLAGDKMARESLVPNGYRLEPLASNQLVVIVAKDRTERPGRPLDELLAQGGTMAVADPDTAPLGSYTEEALSGLRLGCLLVPLQDAEAVLSAVALGHADRGVVYRSDALRSAQVKAICSLPPQRHRPILYVAALPPRARAQSGRLVASLLHGKGRLILEEQGFTVPLDSSEGVTAVNGKAAK
jgi:molybdate transport system substrate-binding protein